MSDAPIWTYDTSRARLAGPAPVPDVPPLTEISAEQLGANAEHDVVEIDQELGLAVLGTGYVPQPECHVTRVECPFRIPDWHLAGWYARYRRHNSASPFVLTHIWADEWGATRFTPWC